MSDPIRAAYLRGQHKAYGHVLKLLEQASKRPGRRGRRLRGVLADAVCVRRFVLDGELRRADPTYNSAVDAGLLRLSGDLWKEEE